MRGIIVRGLSSVMSGNNRKGFAFNIPCLNPKVRLLFTLSMISPLGETSLLHFYMPALRTGRQAARRSPLSRVLCSRAPSDGTSARERRRCAQNVFDLNPCEAPIRRFPLESCATREPKSKRRRNKRRRQDSQEVSRRCRDTCPSKANF